MSLLNNLKNQKEKVSTIPGYELGPKKKKVHNVLGGMALGSLMLAVPVAAAQPVGTPSVFNHPVFHPIQHAEEVSDNMLNLEHAVTQGGNKLEEINKKFEEVNTQLEDTRKKLEETSEELEKTQTKTENLQFNTNAVAFMLNVPKKIEHIQNLLTNIQIELNNGVSIINLESKIYNLGKLITNIQKETQEIEVDRLDANVLESLKEPYLNLGNAIEAANNSVYKLKLNLSVEKTFNNNSYLQVNQTGREHDEHIDIDWYFSPSGEFAGHQTSSYNNSGYTVTHDGAVFTSFKGKESIIGSENYEAGKTFGDYILEKYNNLTNVQTQINDDTITFTNKIDENRKEQISLTLDNNKFINEYLITYTSDGKCLDVKEGKIKVIDAETFSNIKYQYEDKIELIKTYDNLIDALEKTYTQNYLKVETNAENYKDGTTEHRIALLNGEKAGVASKLSDGNENYTIYNYRTGVYEQCRTNEETPYKKEKLSIEEQNKMKDVFASMKDQFQGSLDTITYSPENNSYTVKYKYYYADFSQKTTYVVNNGIITDVAYRKLDNENKLVCLDHYKNIILTKEKYEESINKIENNLNELKNSLEETSSAGL